MTLAASDTDPTWLKLVIAFVPPTLAAIIAGYVALSNTVNRRAERLKNLNELRVSSDSDRVNPDYALELIILRELKGLDRATSPILKRGRYFGVIYWIIAPLLYVIAVLYSVGFIHPSIFSRALSWTALVASIAMFTYVYCYLHVWEIPKSKKALNQKYDAKMAVLGDEIGAGHHGYAVNPAHEPADGSPPDDRKPAQKAAEKRAVAPARSRRGARRRTTK